MKLIYLKSALKCDPFDAAIGIKIPFFRVSVTIEPGCSLLQFVITNCLIGNKCCYFNYFCVIYLWMNLPYELIVCVEVILGGRQRGHLACVQTF